MRYFIIRQGGELGPFEPDELRSLLNQGSIAAQDPVRPEEGGPRAVLGDVLSIRPCSGGAPAAVSSIQQELFAERRDGFPGGPIQAQATSTDEAPADGEPVRPHPGLWTIAGSAITGLLGAFFFMRRGGWTFMDGVDLVIHEAGHMILAFFPKFIAFLGGTLFQLLIPAVCLFYFIRTRKDFASQFCMVWVGQSILNVSRYVADARAMVLPLVGGGEHDWFYLLGTLGLLEKDLAIARGLNLIAFLVFVLAVFWPWRHFLPKAGAKATEQA